MNWKPVVGFEERYLVSDSGQVWSLYRHKALTPAIDRYGYEKVALCKDGKPHSRTVHRLVAQAFIPNPHNHPTVNHKNEVKTDNRAVNLEWLSIADNDNHGTRNARMADTKCRLPVEQVFEDGTTVRYKGVKDASRKTGINRCCIALCCKNIRKTAGGYKWRYYDERTQVV
jgi:hypothetical protein